ncbi:hypothetical protein B0H15DRAFT_862494 [Mycena belliarum]|uniref:TEA domain-containing protein n=1 Tax=Mycena belliarum TaxID=1033014 RepID=A0AAD6TRR1_9AGAR|nr:hypothetical protein B0H15DRAFT_862494 [Mycena belliae]
MAGTAEKTGVRSQNKPCPYAGNILCFHITDLKKNITKEEEEEYERQVKTTNRKSYKHTDEGLTWDSELEGELIKAMRDYDYREYGEPQKSARIFKKHFFRNKYISLRIFQRTNRVRTPRQVGSRIQQIRNKSTDPEVQRLTRSLRRAAKGLAEPMTSSRRPLETAEDNRFIGGTRLSITVKSPSARFPSLAPEINLGSSPQSQDIQLRTFEEWQPFTSTRCGMDPTVILLSPFPLNLYCTFEVSRKNNRDWTSPPTILLPDGKCGRNWRYVTSVGADLWSIISDPEGECFEWTVLQQLFREEDDFSQDEAPIKLVYNFQPRKSAQESPSISRTQAPVVDVLPQVHFDQRLTPTPSRTPLITLPQCPFAKSPEQFLSTSGTSLEENIRPGVPDSKQARSMPAAKIFSSAETFEQEGYVSPRTKASISSEPPYMRDNRIDACCQAEFEPLFSWFAGWNELEIAVSCGSYEAALYSGAAYLSNGYAFCDSHSNSEDPLYPVVNSGTSVTPNIGRLSLPVYSFTGEYLGRYHIHDYN